MKRRTFIKSVPLSIPLVSGADALINPIFQTKNSIKMIEIKRKKLEFQNRKSINRTNKIGLVSEIE